MSGKTKKMLQNKEKSNGDDNNQKELVPKTSSVISIIDENMLLYDILNRIPAKSLMQFKCVSKPWRSLIRDPCFVDLHFNRSKTLQRFFFTIPQVRSGTEKKLGGSITKIIERISRPLAYCLKKAVE